MFFFQFALLSGYVTAHFLAINFSISRQLLLQGFLIILSLFFFPIRMKHEADLTTDLSPAIWLLLELVKLIGIPFLLVTITAPLLQSWFSRSDHPRAQDPYFLYSASNLGGLAALISYPLLIEPASTLTTQANVWVTGFKTLGILIFLCALCVILWKPRQNSAASKIADITQEKPAPNIITILWWISASFVPSSFLLSVTTYITSNIAPIPLFWVIPLAIYLITFILTFSRFLPFYLKLSNNIFPYALLPIAPLFFIPVEKFGIGTIFCNLFFFFVSTMICHGRLANSRPDARFLTGFYFWISVGGALGGFFNSILAPIIFNSIAEYPLMVILSCFFIISRRQDDKSSLSTGDFLIPVGILLLGFAVGYFSISISSLESYFNFFLIFVLSGFICLFLRDRPMQFGLSYGALIISVAWTYQLQIGNVILRTRNFFGEKEILIDREANIKELLNGTTTHGCQSLDPMIAAKPLAYYHPQGPLGDIFSISKLSCEEKTAIIGLGAGSMAFYAKPKQRFVFYEIDPIVGKIAENPEYFSFLKDCKGEWEIIIQDGRLGIAKTPNDSFGMIIIDAFSSDSIPTHLFTKEAIDLYLSKLSSDGLIVFHISNKFLLIEPMLGNLAISSGLFCVSRYDAGSPPGTAWIPGKFLSHYLVMSRNSSIINELLKKNGWRTIAGNEQQPYWTDDYSYLLPLMYFGS